MKQFTIKVPASSANIGPGFDVLGVGLNLYLEIEVIIDPSVDTSSDPHHALIQYEGSLAEKVPLQTDRNLVTQCALYVMRANGMANFENGTQIRVKNPVPLSRGLGSSASAIVGGIMLGNEIGVFGFDKNRLMDYSLMIERHPDNIAAAMLGGFVGSYLPQLDKDDTAAKSVPLEYILPKPSTPKELVVSTPPPFQIGEYVKYPWNPKIKAVCIVPNFEVSTDDSRAVLPENYERADIIFNLQRLAVLTTALCQEPVNHKLVYEAMKDKIHQPYRSKLIPGLTEVLQTVTPESDPGLCGICLSGAGPTILCLATEGFDAIAKKVISFFNNEGIECEYKLLEVANDGAIVDHQ
ncbi:homoserine kinase [Diutina catenulata]